MISMLKEMLFLQYGFFQGGGIGNMLAQWEALGVFSYAIPFLLLFAIVYGILTQMNLFGGKKTASGRTINAIISLAVGLMALQFDFVPRFFSELFPRLGVGLVILLLVLIFTGLFSNYKSRAMMYSMYGVGAVIVIVVLVLTANRVGWYSYLPILGYNWVNILPWIVLIALVGVIIASAREKRTTEPRTVLGDLLAGAVGERPA